MDRFLSVTKEAFSRDQLEQLCFRCSKMNQRATLSALEFDSAVPLYFDEILLPDCVIADVARLLDSSNINIDNASQIAFEDDTNLVHAPNMCLP